MAAKNTSHEALIERVRLIEGKLGECRNQVEALRLEQRESSSILKNIPLLMITVDGDRRVKYVSEGVLRVTGRKAEEVVGLRGGEALRCIHHLDDPRGCGFGPACEVCVVRNTVLETLGTGKSHFQVQAKLTLVEGAGQKERALLMSTSLLETPEKAVLVSLEDITTLAEKEETLLERERNFSSLAENASEGILVADGRGNHIYANKRAGEITGYSVEELLHTNMKDLAHPDELPRMQERLEKRFAGEVLPNQYEVRVLRKDGETVTLEVHGARTEWGGEIADLVHIQDITERKRAEQEQFRLAKEIRLLLESTGEGIYGTDSDGLFTFINRAAAAMLGYSPEEVIGKPAHELIHHSRSDGSLLPHGECPMFHTLREGQKFRADNEVLWRKDGKSFPVEYASFPIIEGGVIRGAVVSFSDITERRRAEEALRESEARHRTILQTAMDGFCLLDMQGRLVEVNEAYSRMSGYSEQELLTMSISDLEAFEMPADTAAHIKKVMEQGEGRFESRHRRKDGSILELEVSIQYKAAEGGRVVAFLRDVTDHKRAQAALLESENKFKSFSEQSLVGIYLIQDGVFQYVNPKFAQIFGYGVEECEKLPFRNLVFPEDLEKVEEQIRRRISGEVEFVQYTFRGIKKNREVVDVEIYGSSVSHRGKPAAIGTMLDITERGRAESELRASEDKFSMTFRYAPLLMTLSALEDGRYLDVNDEFVKITGFSREDAIGKTSVELGGIRAEDRERLVEIIRADGRVEAMELSLRAKDGREIICLYNGEVITINGKSYLLSLAQDITERKSVEEDLQRKTELNQMLLDTLPCVALLLRPETRQIVATNEAGRKAGAVPGKTCYGTWMQREDPCPWCLAPELWKTGETQHLEVEALNVVWDVHWIPITKDLFLHYAFDITERRRDEARFRQAQKMEAIGTLAGGIAHDFNNILGVIMGCTELTLMEIKKGSRAWENLNEVFKATERAKDLVQQILTFSRQTEQQRKPMRVDLVVKEALKFLRSSLPSTIEIEGKIGKRVGEVMGDPTQIYQVIMNLCVNAGHAMREKGGILSVEVGNTEVSPEEVLTYDLQTPGPYCRLRVSDTGHGMDLATVSRIFDPYFTTKGPGEGTGLGLAIVHGIVKSHGGGITVESEPGKGTTFEILLPRMEKAPEVQFPFEADLPIGKGERILVVDDEPGLAYMYRRMLESLRYRVEVRTSSIEAFRAFSTNPDDYDLVLTDMTMPHMTGLDLSKRILETRPHMPIILCTGFSERINEDKARGKGIRSLIMKPIVRKHLAEAIRKALQSPEDKG